MIARNSLTLLVLIAVGISEISCYQRPNVKLSYGVTVSNDAILEGDITIGFGSVIKPKARIVAEAGPIIIGQGNIIEEGAIILNRMPGNTLMIGNGNTFKANSRCEARRVGDGNVLEDRAFVGDKVVLTNGVIIGNSCSLTIETIVPQGARISGSQCQ